MSEEYHTAQQKPLIKKSQIRKNYTLYSIIQIPLWIYHTGKPSRVNRAYQTCSGCNGYVGFRKVMATTTDKTTAYRLLRYYNRYSPDYHYMMDKNYLVEIAE